MAETTVGNAWSWRLVHDGVKVLSLLASAGWTTSKYTIFTASTEAACNAEIARLGLIPLPPE